MKPTYIYVQDPNVLSNWLSLFEEKPNILYNLDDLPKLEPGSSALLLLHKTDSVSNEEIDERVEQGYQILLFMNQPDVMESIELFKSGVKGVLNTYAAKTVVGQAINSVSSGNVWLGQNIMQAMIQSLNEPAKKQEGWKELLTEREIQVSELVIEGNSNKVIAEQIFVTERTVKAHLQNIFKKLEVKDRLALAIKIQNWQDN